jgi:hypothetical protein
MNPTITTTPLNSLFSGKVRLKLLTRLLLNPGSQVYLRQLQKELNVSSNTVRLELNKLSAMKLISTLDSDEGKIKRYMANALHPLYSNLRGIILKYMGVDHLIEEVFYKLGDLEEVYLTGEIAEGKNTPFIDLVVVGDIDRVFFNQLVEKAEGLLNKKIRTAIYSLEEFRPFMLKDIVYVSVFKREKGIKED